MPPGLSTRLDQPALRRVHRPPASSSWATAPKLRSPRRRCLDRCASPTFSFWARLDPELATEKCVPRIPGRPDHGGDRELAGLDRRELQRRLQRRALPCEASRRASPTGSSVAPTAEMRPCGSSCGVLRAGYLPRQSPPYASRPWRSGRLGRQASRHRAPRTRRRRYCPRPHAPQRSAACRWRFRLRG